jgi:WXG100 family type VII secretion target
VTSGLIKYQYSAIEDGVSQMRKVNANIEQEVGDLTGQVKTLLADFQGSASQAYDASANKIAQLLTDSNAKLNTLSTKVSNGATNMQTTDSRQAGRFC